MSARNEGYAYLVAFILTIPAANWMIGNVGAVCPENSPCLIPVGFDVMAPSGVIMVGLALVLRDLVQRRLGKLWALGAIVVGALLSALIAPRALVLASGAAFLVSELADFAVYTPLQKKRLVLAVLMSGVVGLFVDSILFLQLAFGSLDYLSGQIIGKTWMIVLALPIIWWIRRRDEKLGVVPE